MGGKQTWCCLYRYCAYLNRYELIKFQFLYLKPPRKLHNCFSKFARLFLNSIKSRASPTQGVAGDI